MECELCCIESPEKASEYWIITTCHSCDEPMVALKRHSETMSMDELRDLTELLCTSFYTTFRHHRIRTQARKILDHIHFHLV